MSSRPSFLWGRFFLPALLILSVAAKAEIETVADKEGHFVASFPQPIQRDSQRVDTAAGEVTMNKIFYDAGTVACMVVYSDYPAGSIEQTGGPAKVCENASKAALKGLEDGKLRSSSPCQLDGVKGLEIVVDVSSSQAVVRIRFFVIGDRLYQVMYLCPAGQEDAAAARAFFDSFRLTR